MQSKIKALITEKDIKKRVTDLAKKINEDLQNEKVVCISVLRGSVIFFSDIVRQFNFPLRFDFIRTSSYVGTESEGKVKIHRDTFLDVAGKTVLLIEDIVDTGKTLTALKKEFLRRGAKKILTVVLLDKPKRRIVPFNADYIGFEIEDVFVVGYGMDHNDMHRNLPYIGIIEE